MGTGRGIRVKPICNLRTDPEKGIRKLRTDYLAFQVKVEGDYWRSIVKAAGAAGSRQQFGFPVFYFVRGLFMANIQRE